MSDITLTAGIRQNLLSLQHTSADLTTTQNQLATGKKVNSAADNPSSFFTAQNLTNSANSLSALLDQVGQGQQTINAATDGLTGISSLLQQALATVQQAQQASQTGGSTTGSVTVTTATIGTAATGNLNIVVGSSTYTIAVSASETASQIEAAINATSGLGSSGAVTASDNGSGEIVLTSNTTANFTVKADATSAALGLTKDASTDSVVYPGSSTRTTLQSNYNGLLTQINQLAGDASYNGVNLLNGANLTIDFNQAGTSSLTISGVTYNAAGLGLSTISGSGAGSFQDSSALSGAVTAINTAISDVQTQTETFGTNSGVIGTRQTFMTNLINTLQTGASNLVLADQNQASADLLTEQTRQQLEISALSIANQANQSVLKLFP